MDMGCRKLLEGLRASPRICMCESVCVHACVDWTPEEARKLKPREYALGVLQLQLTNLHSCLDWRTRKGPLQTDLSVDLRVLSDPCMYSKDLSGSSCV